LTFVLVLFYSAQAPQNGLVPMQEIMRCLHERGPANPGIAVDAEGAMLGPDCVLVRRTPQGYRCIDDEEATALQACLFGDRRDSDWLFGRCHRIAKALDNDDVPLAQIFGIYIGIGALDAERLKRLALTAPMIKANFDPGEARISAGQPGGGQWTSGGGNTDTSSGTAGGNTDGSSGPAGAKTGPIIPAQLAIPLDLPLDMPWEIPGMPTEITPIPFDLPGAQREPPVPTNPYPDDPECEEEWRVANKYCREQQNKGKLKPGYAGWGKNLTRCILGMVSERCGGNEV